MPEVRSEDQLFHSVWEISGACGAGLSEKCEEASGTVSAVWGNGSAADLDAGTIESETGGGAWWS